MALKVGLNSRSTSSPKSNTSSGGGNFTPVRVVKIILDNKTDPELFKEFGEWSSIGAVFFESVQTPYRPDSFDLYKKSIAYPLFPNIKNYPLVNELVYIVNLPSTDIQTNTTTFRNYYINPINLWNSNHHNAVPNTVFNSLLPESQQKDYVQTSTGNVRRVTDGSTEIPLGNTFVERTNIKSLLPYEGDVIYEGRWGNSMRIGSTVNNAGIPNNWSTSGDNGDPLIIIRNGQFNDGKDPWVPIVEDINKDKSSIYVTSTQNIPVKTETNYKSYTSETPTSPNQYSGHQIILNSGRLVFNSTSDHILLSSNKTISFNAVKGFNFDTNSSFTVNSKQIKLGSKDATEPLLLGNKTIEIFQQILTSLQSLANVLPTVGTSESTVPGTPNIKVTTAAANLSATLGELIPRLESLKSKQNYTL
jgi:hypothetical protein